MSSGKQAKPGPFARAISAEVRADMARLRINSVQLSARAGMSRTYLGKRLRNETPFTFNDAEALCAAMGLDLHEFIQSAFRTMSRDQ